MKTDEILYRAQEADRNAHDALSLAVKRAYEHAAELKRYLDQLEVAKTQRSKADILNWAINHAVQGVHNFRLDRVAAAQAQLEVVRTLRHEAGMGADNEDCQMLVILSKVSEKQA